MVITVAAAIGKFVFESALSGIIGNESYHVLCNFYETRHKSRIENLYVNAIETAFKARSRALEQHAESGTTLEIKRDALLKLIQSELDFEVPAPSILTESDFVNKLTQAIDLYLILPGHPISIRELEWIAKSTIHYAAEAFLQELTMDETAFREAVLREVQIATYDRQTIIELLDRLPHTFREETKKLDEQISKLRAIFSKTRLITVGFDELCRTCQILTIREIATIPKYDSHLYVLRHRAQWEFEQFLKSEDPCFLVLGEAGSGKTNLFCHLTKECSRTYPTLLLKGKTPMAGRLGFHTALADELAAALRISDDPYEILQALNALMVKENSTFLVFIDAINENSVPSQIAESLGRGIEDIAGSKIKVCISCRDIDWRLFSDEVRLTRYLYEPKLSTARVTKGVFIESFDESELAVAWNKYRDRYGLKGNLSPNLAQICKQPLMLHFLCEAFSGQTVPSGIHRKEIFDKYWKEKISKPGQRNVEGALYALADWFWASRVTSIFETETIGLMDENTYNLLLSEHVIIYVFRDKVLEQNMVGFTYEAFLEYTLARHIWLKYQWITATSDKLHADLQLIINQADSFRIMQGVLSFLLLFCSDRTLVARVVQELCATDLRWQLFCCDLCVKLDAPNIEIVSTVVRLANNFHPQLRWAVGDCIGRLAVANTNAAHDLIERLIAQEAWQAREVAATASGELNNTDRAYILLSELADDINWRVRRAVGYSLNNLSTTCTEATFDQLESWLKSPKWRLRQAVAKSQKGLLVAPEKSLRILARLAEDANEEVRWLTVISLVSIAWQQSIQSDTIKLLIELANDGNYFVRKQIATLVPEIYNFAENASQPLVQVSIKDKDHEIRWELARRLGKLPSGSYGTSFLNMLIKDPVKEVRYASFYSLVIVSGQSQYGAELSELESEQKELLRLRERIARAEQILQIPNEVPDLLNSWKGDRYFSVTEALKANTSFLKGRTQLLDFTTLLQSDESEGVRWAVASIMPELPYLEVEDRLQLLKRLLGDRHYWVRREAITSLRSLLNTLSREHRKEMSILLPPLTIDPYAEVRFASLDCMRDLLDQFPELQLPVSQRQEDEDTHVRKYAAQILEQHRNKLSPTTT